MNLQFWRRQQQRRRAGSRWLQAGEAGCVGGLALLASYLFTATIFGENGAAMVDLGRVSLRLLPYTDVLPIMTVALLAAGLLLSRWGDGFTATYPFGLAALLLEAPALLAHNQLAWGVFIHVPPLFQPQLGVAATVAGALASVTLWLALHSLAGLRRLDDQLAGQGVLAADRAAVRQGWRALTFSLLGATLGLTLGALLVGALLSRADAIYAAWPWLVMLAGMAGTAALAVALQLWSQPPAEE